MTDYWKSNPRKFCEVCKCWLADNKPSIDFHEGGRRHQENAKKRLEQARVRSAENIKEKQNLAKTLSAIEYAAFNAYQQDLAGGRVKDAKLPVSPEVEQVCKLQDYLTTEQQKLERELEKKKIEANARQKVQEIQTKILEKSYQAYSSSYLSGTQDPSLWQQGYSPEGYIYYYNTVTGVSQWVAPENFQADSQIPSVVPTTPSTATATAQLLPPTADVSESTSKDEQSLKRPADETELEARIVHPPKRRGPYGAWTTVAVIERNVKEEDQEVQESNTNKAEEDGNTPSSHGEGGIQFEEKRLSGGLETEDNEVKGEFKGFSFKKRTNKGRPKIRQRIGDV